MKVTGEFWFFISAHAGGSVEADQACGTTATWNGDEMSEGARFVLPSNVDPPVRLVVSMPCGTLTIATDLPVQVIGGLMIMGQGTFEGAWRNLRQGECGLGTYGVADSALCATSLCSTPLPWAEHNGARRIVEIAGDVAGRNDISPFLREAFPAALAFIRQWELPPEPLVTEDEILVS